MLDFNKTAINAIMTADFSYIFNDAGSNTAVKWQKADIFDPGAVVRNDTVFALFRAEGNPKAILDS